MHPTLRTGERACSPCSAGCPAVNTVPFESSAACPAARLCSGGAASPRRAGRGGAAWPDRACLLLALQDESTAEITFYMKGADVAMSSIVQYNDWLEEEVTRGVG